MERQYLRSRSRERFRIGKLTVVDADRPVEGDSLGDPASLLALKTFETGEWFSRSRVNEFVSALKNRYQDAGYASVTVVPATKVRIDRRLVDVDIAIKRGALTAN